MHQTPPVAEHPRSALSRLRDTAQKAIPEAGIEAFERAVRAVLPDSVRPSERRGQLGPMPEFEAMRSRMPQVWKRNFTLRSVPVTAGLYVAYTSVRGLVKLGHLADDLLYPEWREHPIDRPVFMFANARSGTTLLHRLMALDEDRFAPIKLYETIFPAASLNKFFDFVGTHDRSGIGRGIVDLLNRAFFGGWKDIHPMGLDKHEEDEATFCLSLHTTTLGLLFPEIDELEDLFWFDKLPKHTRDEFLDFYEASIKRHLYSAAPDKRLLNKNVFYTPRVRSIYERFPDSIFIYMIRSPHESIGSYLDMFHRAWKVHRPDVDTDSRQARALAEMAIRQYRYALELRKVIPASQFLVITYDEITRDPGKTVRRIYRHLGMEPSPAFDARLREATTNQRAWKSEHDYALEDFGITADWVYERLKDVYDEFGFAKPGSASDDAHRAGASA